MSSLVPTLLPTHPSIQLLTPLPGPLVHSLTHSPITVDSPCHVFAFKACLCLDVAIQRYDKMLFVIGRRFSRSSIAMRQHVLPFAPS